MDMHIMTTILYVSPQYVYMYTNRLNAGISSYHARYRNYM
jgi:hypothetical protein